MGLEGLTRRLTWFADFNWAKEHHDLWLKELIEQREPGARPGLPLQTSAE
jgi:hypothetical protein